VFHQFPGFREYTLQESVGLNFLNLMVDLHGGATADDPVEILAMPSKMVTVREESEGILPANEFASHRKNRAVGVHRALLVQHFHGSIDRVQHYDVLTQNRDMRDITYEASKCIISTKCKALTILLAPLGEGEPRLDIRHV